MSTAICIPAAAGVLAQRNYSMSAWSEKTGLADLLFPRSAWEHTGWTLRVPVSLDVYFVNS